jgi:hypothetical protein
VVQYDEGGILDKHVDRWRQIAAQGGSIDILGLCQSACTMVTVYFSEGPALLRRARLSQFPPGAIRFRPAVR